VLGHLAEQLRIVGASLAIPSNTSTAATIFVFTPQNSVSLIQSRFCSSVPSRSLTQRRNCEPVIPVASCAKWPVSSARGGVNHHR
jgi:hypothetical protein